MNSYLDSRSNTGNKESNNHSTAARIATGEGKIDGFLKYMPTFLAVKSLIRKIILWRAGCIPGKIQECTACTEGPRATRDHLTKCSGLESILRGEVSGSTKNILDGVLNDNELMKSRTIWEKLKDGVKSLWSNCLGRRWAIEGIGHTVG